MTISCCRTTTTDAVFYFTRAHIFQVGVFPIVENGDFEERTRQGVDKKRNGGRVAVTKELAVGKNISSIAR